MDLLKKYLYLDKSNYKISFELNIHFFLLIINFLTYSIYAVLSRYNIFFIEILINLNFLLYFYFYLKNPNDKLFFNLNLEKKRINFFFNTSIFFNIINVSRT